MLNSIYDEMVNNGGTRNIDTVLSIIKRKVSVKYEMCNVIVVEGIMGMCVDDTVTYCFRWFMCQEVYNKMVVSEMNDHTVTFDKNPATVVRK